MLTASTLPNQRFRIHSSDVSSSSIATSASFSWKPLSLGRISVLFAYSWFKFIIGCLV